MGDQSSGASREEPEQSGVVSAITPGSTLQFDWLSAVFTQYERLFKLPVRNYPFYLIGDNTEEGLKAKAAAIQAVWNRATNQVTLSANVAVPLLFVTGISGGELYGGQYIRRINITTTPASYGVNRGLTQ